MFFIAYAFKVQVHVFAGRVLIVSHSSCRTSAIWKYFCHLFSIIKMDVPGASINVSMRCFVKAHITDVLNGTFRNSS